MQKVKWYDRRNHSGIIWLLAILNHSSCLGPKKDPNYMIYQALRLTKICSIDWLHPEDEPENKEWVQLHWSDDGLAAVEGVGK